MADNCLTEELATQSEAAMISDDVRLLRYGEGSPFIDFRLPCGSGLDIVIDPTPDRRDLARCVADLDARRETTLELPVDARGGLLRRRHYMPSLRLLVFGTGSECAALAVLGKAQGAEVIRREPGHGLALHQPPQDLSADRWTAVLLLFHDHEWEHALLKWALATPAFYIGAQGGAPARQNRIDRLRATGCNEDDIARLTGPVGLIPHARDPGVLALSILAEVVGAYEALHPHR